MTRTEQERSLRSILNVLRDYLDHLILIGGWVPYLHLAYGPAASETATTSLTAEADLLVPEELNRRGRRPIGEILDEAGFRPTGSTRVIWAREPRTGQVIEFLRSHRGPADSLGQSHPIAGQPGLSAIALDHL